MILQNGNGGGNGGGGGGGGQQANAGGTYNLEVEVYIFSEETQVAYGGTCADSCLAVDLGDSADSAAECAGATGACTYVSYVTPVADSCSDATQTTQADCTLEQCSGTATEVAATCGAGNDGEAAPAACAVAADTAESCTSTAIVGNAEAAADTVNCQLATGSPGSCTPADAAAYTCAYVAAATATTCAFTTGTCSFVAAYTPQCDTDVATDATDVCPAGCTSLTPTWTPEVIEVPESCTQTAVVDCGAKAVDCPRGVCDATMCEGADACAFTPENVGVPANAVKYNIGSSTWPFCGDYNFLSVVVDMQADGGGADDGSSCTAVSSSSSSSV